MKRVLTAAFTALLATSTAFAGTIDKGKDKVSYFSEESFHENFGNIPILEWQSTAAFDKAYFMQDGREYTAYFTRDGEFVGTTHDVAFSELPVAAQKAITKKYGEAAIEKVFNFDDNENSDAAMLIENNAVENNDNYFVILNRGNAKLILQVSMEGVVSFFKEVK
jgi:hypothetical protein